MAHQNPLNSSGSSFPVRKRGPFKRLTVDAHFNMITSGTVLVEWAMQEEFEEAGPYVFTLYRGGSGISSGVDPKDWTPVAEVTDQPWAYDRNPVRPQKGRNYWYKVVLVTGEGNTYESQAVNGGTYWDRYDWSVAKEIIRKEHLLLRKRAGTKGWLLKARWFGDACPDCIDPVTGQQNEADCTTCSGTGVLGGYYEPVEFWVLMNPSQRVRKLDANQGLVTEVIETVRCLAYPSPEPQDVWVNAQTDQRYYILGDRVAAARHRGIDLVYNIRLQERARSESIYDIPVPC